MRLFSMRLQTDVIKPTHQLMNQLAIKPLEREGIPEASLLIAVIMNAFWWSRCSICGKEAREGLRYHMTTSIITLSKTTTLCWFMNRPKCEHTLEQSYSDTLSVRMNTDGLEQLWGQGWRIRWLCQRRGMIKTPISHRFWAIRYM